MKSDRDPKITFRLSAYHPITISPQFTLTRPRSGGEEAVIIVLDNHLDSSSIYLILT